MEQDPFTPPPTTNMTPLPVPPRAPDAHGNPYIFHCVGCGNTLSDATLGGACPHCGTPTDQSLQRAAGTNNGTPGSAIASLVLGIAAIVSCLFYGLPAIICGILAIVFASRADRLIRSGQFGSQGQGMATAGRICGWIGLALGLIYMVLIILYIVFAFTMFHNMPNNPNWQNTQPNPHHPWVQPANPNQQPAAQPGNTPTDSESLEEAIDEINEAMDELEAQSP
ncbi:MAG: DUF4190 domain-containing protein [Planctomycetota bacterium]